MGDDNHRRHHLGQATKIRQGMGEARCQHYGRHHKRTQAPQMVTRTRKMVY